MKFAPKLIHEWVGQRTFTIDEMVLKIETNLLKDTCRKSYVMRPLSDRKNCEQHLIAHFQWRFLRLFEQSVEVNIVMNK